MSTVIWDQALSEDWYGDQCPLFKTLSNIHGRLTSPLHSSSVRVWNISCKNNIIKLFCVKYFTFHMWQITFMDYIYFTSKQVQCTCRDYNLLNSIIKNTIHGRSTTKWMNAFFYVKYLTPNKTEPVPLSEREVIMNM